MSDRNTVFLLEDIVECIDNILKYTKGMSFDDYADNDMVQDAVERNYEIIGEAASRFDLSFREKYPNIDWRLLKDFRNVIIHRYFNVAQDILWNAKEFQLPELKEKIISVIELENNV